MMMMMTMMMMIMMIHESMMMMAIAMMKLFWWWSRWRQQWWWCTNLCRWIMMVVVMFDLGYEGYRHNARNNTACQERQCKQLEPSGTRATQQQCATKQTVNLNLLQLLIEGVTNYYVFACFVSLFRLFVHSLILCQCMVIVFGYPKEPQHWLSQWIIEIKI